MDENIIIPLAFFATVGGLVWLVSHFNSVRRRTTHETLRLAIEKGQDVSPAMIERLSAITDPRKTDLRRGVIFLTLGAAFLALAVIVGTAEAEAIRPLLGVAVFPLLIGCAFLGLWRFGHDRPSP